MASLCDTSPVLLCSVCTSVDFDSLIRGKADVDRLAITRSPDVCSKLGVLEDIRQRSPTCSLCRLISTYAETKRDAYLKYQLGQWSKHMPGEYPEDAPIECAIYRSPYVCASVDGEDLQFHRLEIKIGTHPVSRPDFTLISLQPSSNPAPTVQEYCDDESFAQSKFPSGRLIDPTIDIRLLRSWYSLCTSQHGSSCSKPSWSPHEEKAPPSLRLIDIQKRCIVEAPENCSYFALSYVWGAYGDNCLDQTTSQNISMFKQNGALTEEVVSPTIHDAMMLVVGLNGRYLWADRMCIIQDDNEDKARQIPLMDSIYACACLTIVAASGSGARDGLAGWTSRPRKLQQDVVKANQWLTLLAVPEIEGTAYRNCTWRTRGWTLQEKICSARTVTFTKDLMFWSCECQDWFENLSFEQTSNYICKTQPGDIALSGYYEPHNKRTRNKFDIYHHSALVNQYSSRRLTNQSDGLAAIDGLLRRMRKSTGYQFYWGHILASQFGESLAWDSSGCIRRQAECIISDGDGTIRKSKFPSWSWLGWQGILNLPAYQSRTDKPELEFYKLDIEGNIASFSLRKEETGTTQIKKPTFSPWASAWKGETKVTINTDPHGKKPFRDSGRLIFWTSHARLRLKKMIKMYTSAFQVLEWRIVNSSGQFIGRLKGSSALEAVREDEYFSFVIVSRVYYTYTTVDQHELNVLLVSWDDREKNVVSRICSGIVDEDAWVEVEREWLLVTLQ